MDNVGNVCLIIGTHILEPLFTHLSLARWDLSSCFVGLVVATNPTKPPHPYKLSQNL